MVPNTPSASQALRSAWIPAAEAQGRSQPLAGQLCASAWQRTPAPPPESEPATVSITGAAEPATPDTSSESAARNDGRGIFRKGRKTKLHHLHPQPHGYGFRFYVADHFAPLLEARGITRWEYVKVFMMHDAMHAASAAPWAARGGAAGGHPAAGGSCAVAAACA